MTFDDRFQTFVTASLHLHGNLIIEGGGGHCLAIVHAVCVGAALFNPPVFRINGPLGVLRSICGVQLAEERAGAATRETAAAEVRATLEFTLQEANIAKEEIEEQLATAKETAATLSKELEAANTYQQEIEGKTKCVVQAYCSSMPRWWRSIARMNFFLLIICMQGNAFEQRTMPEYEHP